MERFELIEENPGTQETMEENGHEEEEQVVEVEPANEESDCQQPQKEVQAGHSNLMLAPVRLPGLLDGEFFTVVRLEDNNVSARCAQCSKIINGSLKSTGNFLSHIKRVHSHSLDRVKMKSGQRRPAAIFIDVSGKPDMLQNKRLSKIKAVRMDGLKIENVPNDADESFDNTTEWVSEEVHIQKRNLDEMNDSRQSPRTLYRDVVVHSDDEYDMVGRNVAAKLKRMRVDQRIIAEKLLNDVIFEAQLGNLHRDSHIQP